MIKLGKKKYALINGEVLKWARERTNLTMEEISLRAKNINIENIVKWEKESEYPSITEAKILSDLYDIPFATLFLSEVPKISGPKFIDRRTYKDENISISYELWKEINRLMGCRQDLIEMASEDVPKNELNFINNENYVSKTREIFEIKTPFKNKSQYKDSSYNYFRNLFEKVGIMVLQIERLTIEQIRGISLNYEILPIIAVNRSDSDRGKVFTMFHELSHLIRRSSNLCLIDINNEKDDEEKICNEMAANILMPESVFKESIKNIGSINDSNIGKLADCFAVSRFVILKRLYDLNLINYNFYMQKYNEYIGQATKIKMNKKKVGFALPDKMFISGYGKLYPSLILKAYYEGKVSYGEVYKTFGVQSKYLSSIEKAVMLDG